MHSTSSLPGSLPSEEENHRRAARIPPAIDVSLKTIASASNPVARSETPDVARTDPGRACAEDVSRLAAGLAHDLNNLLAIIHGGAGLVRAALPAESTSLAHVETIERATRRAADLCRSFVASVRPDAALRELVDLEAIVRETVVLLQTGVLGGHRVHVEAGTTLRPFLANATQLRRTLMNLLINAAEACGVRGGKIRVSISVVRLSAVQASNLHPVGARAPGEYVRLRIGDNGSGMDDATLARLYTPYFSTKGSGRGLGLAGVLEHVVRHGGGLRVHTEPGRGTLFDVFLPFAEPAAAAADVVTRSLAVSGRTARTPGSAATTGRPERLILVVDDEQILRDSLGAFLGAQHWEVRTVGDGSSALAFLEQNPRTGLVLLDVTMPRMGGYDTLVAMRQRGLSTPVILMSGHVSPEIEAHFATLAPAGFLEKPFSLVDLQQRLAALLPA